MYGVQNLHDDDVRRAAEGDQDARASVIEALNPQVRVMVVARLSPHPGHFDLVDEITQQTMMAILSAFETMQNRTVAGLKSLASIIVVRRVADYIRRKPATGPDGRRVISLDTTVAGISQVGPLWQFLSASGSSPLSQVRLADQLSMVVGELGQLKDEYRDVITLAFFDQLPTRDIAERLGISRRAASMLLLRAVRALRSRVVDLSQKGISHDDSN